MSNFSLLVHPLLINFGEWGVLLLLLLVLVLLTGVKQSQLLVLRLSLEFDNISMSTWPHILAHYAVLHVVSAPSLLQYILFAQSPVQDNINVFYSTTQQVFPALSSAFPVYILIIFCIHQLETKLLTEKLRNVLLKSWPWKMSIPAHGILSWYSLSYYLLHTDVYQTKCDKNVSVLCLQGTGKPWDDGMRNRFRDEPRISWSNECIKTKD